MLNVHRRAIGWRFMIASGMAAVLTATCVYQLTHPLPDRKPRTFTVRLEEPSE